MDKLMENIYDDETGNGILSNYHWGMRSQLRRQQTKQTDKECGLWIANMSHSSRVTTK